MNSIKWDYWQNVGAARDEYTTAKLALHSMSKRSNGYSSHQLEHVDDLRNKFINRSVSFICRESRAERPRMWSALHLSMLDWDKINGDDPHDETVYSVLKYLLRALAWDSAPIGDNNNLFTCDDFHTYINLSARLEGERQFITDLWAVVETLEDMGKVGVRNAETISRYIVDAAAKSGDDRHMWAYVQQFRYDDDEKDSIEDHIFSNPSEQASKRALLARIRLRSEPDIATSLCPAIGAASTSRLIEAAQRWRNEINARASNGNTLWESDARIANALVCCELAGRNHITASDLAELIETMSGKRTFHDLMLNTTYGRQHVYYTETLIDAVCPQMTS